MVRCDGLAFQCFMGRSFVLQVFAQRFETDIDSEERWKSEGIQVGGPRSARGVLGTWFDK